MLLGELKNKLNELLMPALAYEWDNVGLLIGEEQRTVKNILITLEINSKVIEESIACRADLIISHHPVIFSGLKKITDRDEKGKQILELIKNRIAVYSCHTNYDIIEEGLNDYLCSLLSLDHVRPLTSLDSEDQGIGRWGLLKAAMSLEDFAAHLSSVLELKHLRIIQGNQKDIQKVGMVTGAGMEYLSEAMSKDCDVFVTGDVKYHEAQDAKEAGYNVIDAGHYGTEIIFNRSMKALLENQFGDSFHYFAAKGLEDPFISLSGLR